MEALLRSKLPPGFRFHPTDEELFMFYLKRKVLGKSLGPQMMSEVDVFQFAPWELPHKACLRSRDRNWFFLCPRSKKYPNGGRTNRATVHGYWKSTGNDKTFNFKNRHVGKIKTLIFHRGKVPKGERTDWVLHEYKLEDRLLLEQGVSLDSYVICKVYEKSGVGPKNGEDYGARFVEEEWDSDNDDNLESGCGLVWHPDANAISMTTMTEVDQPAPVGIAQNQDSSVVISTLAGPNHAGPSTPSTMQEQLNPPVTEGEPLPLPPIGTEADEFDRLLAMFTGGDGNPIPEKQITSGFEGFPDGSLNSESEFDWTRLMSDNYYLEMNDLLLD